MDKTLKSFLTTKTNAEKDIVKLKSANNIDFNRKSTAECAVDKVVFNNLERKEEL